MRQILRRAAIFALAIAAATPSQDSRNTRRVLFLTHSAGYVHDVVKRPAPDQLSLAEKELTKFDIGSPYFWIVEATQDCAVLTPENLRGYDVVVFYTTGELPAPAGGAQALLDWIRAGGGFVGIHCGTDTWYTVPAYGDMIGGVFESHPWNQVVRVNGGNYHYEIADEIYQFKRFDPEPLDVELALDLSSVDASKGTREDGFYALAWKRDYGNGRVFYTALGHRDSVWKDRWFRNHLFSGIEFAAFPAERREGRAPPGARRIGPAELVHWDQSPARWRTIDRALEVLPKTGDVISKEKFGDFRLHLEFRVPQHPDTDKGQARGNSGVYLQDRYEIQILDSFGLEPKAVDCGAIYGKKAPLTNACRKAGEWQSYDVRLKAARFDAAGKKIANARASVWQNGLKIHDDVEIDGPTVAGQPETPEPGPLRLQDHGNLVAFRNVWVVPR